MFKCLKSVCSVLLIGAFFLAQETQSASLAMGKQPATVSNLNQPYHNQLEDLIAEASQHLQTQSVLPQDKLQKTLSAKDDLVTSIKKLKEQSELYQMINDMLKAESQVQKLPYTIEQDEYEEDEGHHEDDHEHHDHGEAVVDSKQNPNLRNNQQRQQQQLKPKSH